MTVSSTVSAPEVVRSTTSTAAVAVNTPIQRRAPVCRAGLEPVASDDMLHLRVVGDRQIPLPPLRWSDIHGCVTIS
jgi:hypothetical protein